MTGRVMQGWRPLAAMAAVLAAQGCAQVPVASAPQPRIFAVDQQGGARACTVPGDVALVPSQTSRAEMSVVNDGGWCGILVARPGPRPYAAGLVTSRPVHGRVHIRTYGNRTRVDYFPDAGYVGQDGFTVRMLPDSAALQVAVTVQPGPAVVSPAAAPAAPVAPSRPAARPAPGRAGAAAPARRSTRTP